MDELIESDVKALAVELVIAMQTTPLARTLPSRSGTGNLRADLFKLGSYVESPQFKSDSFFLLFERVENGTDQEILAALFSLLRNQVTTPPTVYNEPSIDRHSSPLPPPKEPTNRLTTISTKESFKKSMAVSTRILWVSMRSISKESHGPRKPNKLSTK